MKKFICLLLISLVFLTGCDIQLTGNGVITIETSKNPNKKPSTGTVTLKDQNIDVLQITGFNIVYENGSSTITGSVTNTSQETYQLNLIIIKLYGKDGVLITETIGFVGNSIKPNEKRTFSTNVSKDLLGVVQVQYEIQK